MTAYILWNRFAFAALKADGSVVTWGYSFRADAGDSSDAANDDERLMERLHRALDRLAGEPRRVVLHLPMRMPAGV